MSIEPADEEPDEAQSKPPNPTNVVLAVDITAERFEAALVTATGSLVDRASVLVERDVGPESHYTNLAGIVTEMLTVADERHGVNVVGVGVGSAGPVGRHLEMVSPAGIVSWRDFPLRARLVELTGLAVHGDFDAKVLALAEGWLGAAQGHQNFCTITVSGSVAGGLVLDGDLLDGASGYAGQVGHIIVEPGGRRCVCGAQGCLDAEASGAAIESITGRPLTEPTYEIMQRTGRLVGRAAATVCNTLDLTLVVVGGTIARNFAATFFHSAQAALEEHAAVAVQPRCAHHAVAPRRQRPADRCRRVRVAADPPRPALGLIDAPNRSGGSAAEGAVEALRGADAEAALPGGCGQDGDHPETERDRRGPRRARSVRSSRASRPRG